MNLSTRARYGSRAMAELAVAYPAGSVSVKQLARKQHISIKYLEQIMGLLKTAGLVRSARGTHGGYTLSRNPGAINLGDVYRALEGSTAPVHCVDDPESCPMEGVCPTRDTWVEIEEAISKVLKKTTMRKLAARLRSA